MCYMCSMLSAPLYEAMLIIIFTMFCALHYQLMNTIGCIFTILLSLKFSHICTFVISHQYAFLTDQQLTFLIYIYNSLCIDVYKLIATKPIYFVSTALAKLNGSIAFIIPKHHRQTHIFYYCIYYARYKRDVTHDELLRDFGGRDKNDLNTILTNSQHDSENPISLRSFSPYMYYDDLNNYLRNNINGFSVQVYYHWIFKIFSRNLIHSIPLLRNWMEKTSFLVPFVCKNVGWMKVMWLQLYNFPDYKLIQQSKICCGHGGLIIYLHNTLSYELRNIYTRSDTWEGLFIDIRSDNFPNKITLGNIYRPPKDNNNNTNIETFINELAPLINRFGKEKTSNNIVGDFNMDLLKIAEREKYADVFDMFCTNSFLPKITFPTRFAKHSCSLIDQIYYKPYTSSGTSNTVTAGIIRSTISDHFPSFISLNIKHTSPKIPKFVTISRYTSEAVENIRGDLIAENISQKFAQHTKTIQTQYMIYLIQKMKRGTCSAAVDPYSCACVTGYRKWTEARVVLPSIPTAVLVSLDTENELRHV